MATDHDANTTSEYGFHDKRQRILVAVLYAIVALMGLFGNSLVVLSVLLSRKLRSPINVFVVNLSVADLVTCLASTGSIVSLLSLEGWPLAEWVCSAAAGIIYVATFCSVSTLASIAINRLVLITRPVRVYQKIFSTKVLCAWIAVTWISPFIIIIVPPLVGFGALGYNERFHGCISVSANKYSDEYDLILTFAAYPIQLVIIIVAYIWIFIHVKRVTTKLTEDMTLTITKNMFYVLVAYIVCLTPFFCCLVAESNTGVALIPYASVLLSFNSCINPLLYATKHPGFKKMFSLIVRCRWREIPEPSDTLRVLRQRGLCNAPQSDV